MNVRFSVLGIVSALGLTACTNPASLEGFKHPEIGGIKRAGFDLSCPENQLTVSDLGTYTVGVTGCGKKAVYQYVPSVGWVNNSGGEDPAGGKSADK